MTPKPNKPKKKNGRSYEIEIVFNNTPSLEDWRAFRESVISANIQEHIPEHLQQPLLDKFVEAGLMAP